AAALSGATGAPGRAAAKSPRMTVGENRPRSPPVGAALSPGSLTTSKARARCGRRRMKPRSSSPLIRRWIPDFERSLSASFISSKDGATPVAVSLWLININSSCCFLVNIAILPPGQTYPRTNPKQLRCSSLVPRQLSSPTGRGGAVLVASVDPALRHGQSDAAPNHHRYRPRHGRRGGDPVGVGYARS